MERIKLRGPCQPAEGLNYSVGDEKCMIKTKSQWMVEIVITMSETKQLFLY